MGKAFQHSCNLSSKDEENTFYERVKRNPVGAQHADMREDGLLFGYFETPDSLAAAQAAMEQTDINERWQMAMSPYFELPPDACPDQMLIELEEVFHTD